VCGGKNLLPPLHVTRTKNTAGLFFLFFFSICCAAAAAHFEEGLDQGCHKQGGCFRHHLKVGPDALIGENGGLAIQ